MKEITRKDLQSMDAPADGWYIIEAAGDHPKDVTLTSGSRVEIMQHLTPAVLARVVAAGVPPEGLLIDQDHLSRSLGNTTEAMGWVRELAMCEGDMAARIEWSSVGMELVSGRVYKHFSTVYTAPSPREIAAGAMEPAYLLELALTNKPNNWKGQPPITNRKEFATEETGGDGASGFTAQDVREYAEKGLLPKQGAEAKTQTNTQTKTMNPTILAKLGLAEGATDEEIIAAIDNLQAQVAEAQTAAADAAAAEAEHHSKNRHL